jgi:DNA polymerase III gamma/tau subunit
MVCKEEGVPFQDDALLTIIDSSGGHIRDILNKMEMVAQIGEINLVNTREYLHLTSVSLYYEILLALDQPTKAIELVEQVCENVGADEVVAGIAEAAMNSFRLANKMFAEFLLVDRDMGSKVWDRYKEGTIRLADYFLSNRYASRASLMRDVLLLTQLPGNMPPAGALQTVYILPAGTAVPVGSVPASPATPPASPAPPSSSAPPAAQAAPATGQVAQPPVTSPKPAVNGVNGHGKFPLDPPLHDFGPGPGNWGTPSTYKPNVPVHREPHDESRVLNPDEWRREFLRRLGRGITNG